MKKLMITIISLSILVGAASTTACKKTTEIEKETVIGSDNEVKESNTSVKKEVKTGF